MFVVLSCSNTECRIAESGKCVEGLSAEDCPYDQTIEDAVNLDAEKTQLIEVSAGAGEEKAPKGYSGVSVNSGDMLNISEAEKLLCADNSRVLTIIGPEKAGKTTFSLSLYEAFQNGPYSSLSFAGSSSLVAFEERCHDARVASRRDSPATPRTSRLEGLGFLHIAIRNKKFELTNMLISERAGEYYTDVANSVEDHGNLHEVNRADYVLFMLDGKKFIGSERHGIKHELMMMLSTFVENKVLGNRHSIGIVLTKYDFIAASGQTQRANKDIAQLKKRIVSKFGSTIGNIDFHKIAARSESNEIEQWFGVAKVLKACLKTKPVLVHKQRSLPKPDRFFSRLISNAEGSPT